MQTWLGREKDPVTVTLAGLELEHHRDQIDARVTSKVCPHAHQRATTQHNTNLYYQYRPNLQNPQPAKFNCISHQIVV
jgi:hypothetical protein